MRHPLITCATRTLLTAVLCWSLSNAQASNAQVLNTQASDAQRSTQTPTLQETSVAAGRPNPSAEALHMPPTTLPPEPLRSGREHEHSRLSLVQGPVQPTSGALSAAELAALQAWITAVGPPHPQETFGDFVIRTARAQLGTPYGDPPSFQGTETVRMSFCTFQCVSFVESTLAMARCLWRNTASIPCLTAELISFRYRGGRRAGYASRLHYHEEWLTDNAMRGNLELMTQQLGGIITARPARYMTHHPELYGPLSDPKIFAEIIAMETQVSALHPAVIPRDQATAVAPRLQSGDVVAITTHRSDLLVIHTGFASRHPDGTLHFVNASRRRHRVVETDESLADYLARSPGRQGLMVARPFAPALASDRHKGVDAPKTGAQKTLNVPAHPPRAAR